MTQDDKQFLKEFLTRSGIIGITVGLFILLASLLWWTVFQLADFLIAKVD